MRQKPNVVIILADDLGIGDPQCFNPGSLIPTPNIDRLAVEGMRFTNAYCPDAVCTPTRYALMTGRYAFRIPRFTGVQGNWEPPLIEKDRPILPRLFQDVGYRTAGFGKWHLGAGFPTTDGQPPVGQGRFFAPDSGANVDFAQPIEGGPIDRGFDTWYGFICATEKVIFEQDRFAAILESEDHRGIKPPDTPELEGAPEVQLQDFLEVITDRSVQFIEESVANKQPFLLYFSPYVPHIPLLPATRFEGTTRAGPYGDYVANLDYDIGRILTALDALGVADNTIFVFASDNGSQFTTTGEGHRPNYPVSGIKWTVREGGVRNPMIIRWPDRIPADTVTDQLASLNDLMATLASAANIALPDGAGPDSVNLLPALTGSAAEPLRKSLIVRSGPGLMGLRYDKWKLIAGPDDRQPVRGKVPLSQYRLYDLEADPTESKDISEANPEIVEKLSKELNRIVQYAH